MLTRTRKRLRAAVQSNHKHVGVDMLIQMARVLPPAEVAFNVDTLVARRQSLAALRVLQASQRNSVWNAVFRDACGKTSPQWWWRRIYEEFMSDRCRQSEPTPDRVYRLLDAGLKGAVLHRNHDTVHALLKLGASHDHACILACRQNDVNLVQVLADQTPNWFQPDVVFEQACRFGSESTASFLMHRYFPTYELNLEDGMSEACASNQTHVVRCILAFVDREVDRTEVTDVKAVVLLFGVISALNARHWELAVELICNGAEPLNTRSYGSPRLDVATARHLTALGAPPNWFDARLGIPAWTDHQRRCVVTHAAACLPHVAVDVLKLVADYVGADVSQNADPPRRKRRR